MEKNCISLCFLVIMFMVLVRSGQGQLKENFYSSTCPNVEAIVRQAVTTKVRSQQALPIAIPATIRLFFHDCVVEGCDGSVLIQSPNNDAEKDAPDNLSLAGDGFDTVIKAKEAVEAQCPGVVSCADTLALAARDVVAMAGGPSYKVELGRRDGVISQKSRVAGNIPDPNFNVKQLSTMFTKHNLTQIDMIALSGAHTVGFSHCNRFSNRINSKPVDPTMDPNYAKQLRETCTPTSNPGQAVNLDPVTSMTFDNVYFQNLVAGKGLLTSDQVLFTDQSSRPTVVSFANNADKFRTSFVEAMRKLGRVGVKTGNVGEIRTDCTSFNS